MPKALICKRAGEWREVLELQEAVLPGNPPAGMARVRMLAAAVHPSDFGMIAGTYGKAKQFPCAMGREGVGEIVGMGPTISENRESKIENGKERSYAVCPGDWVRIPESAGVWQEELDVPAEGLFALPKNVPVEQLALSFVNPPTAWRVLEDFVALKAGDAVVTNAGRSAVSQAFVQLAKARGLRAHAVVRNKTPEDEEWLKGLGAEAVWDETEEYFKQVKAGAGMRTGVQLALNQVGGESVLRLIKALGEGGVCVTIGGAAKEPVRYPTRELIFNDVALRGFWMDKWYRVHSAAEARAMLEELWKRMAAGALTQEVGGRFKLAEWQTALGKAQEGGRRGKIVFVG